MNSAMTLVDLLSDLRAARVVRSGMLRAVAGIRRDGEHLVELGWCVRVGLALQVTTAGLDVLHACRLVALVEAA
jgi:hypothetical protein